MEMRENFALAAFTRGKRATDIPLDGKLNGSHSYYGFTHSPDDGGSKYP